MPIVKEVKPLSIGKKQIKTKWGLKDRYYLFVENEEVPYGTWNKAFALALEQQIGKVVKIAYEPQGEYKNLVVPEKFRGSEGKFGLILEKLEQIDRKLDQFLKEHGNKKNVI